MIPDDQCNVVCFSSWLKKYVLLTFDLSFVRYDQLSGMFFYTMGAISRRWR